MYTQENSPFSRVRKTTKGKGRNFRTTKESNVRKRLTETDTVARPQVASSGLWA